MYFIAWLTGGKHFQLYLWSVQYWHNFFLSRSLHASCWRDLIEIKNQIQYIKSLEMSDNLWPVTRKSIYGNEHISINSTVQKQNKTKQINDRKKKWFGKKKTLIKIESENSFRSLNGQQKIIWTIIHFLLSWMAARRRRRKPQQWYWCCCVRDFIASIIRGIYTAPNMNDNSTCSAQISPFARNSKLTRRNFRKAIIQRLHIC